MHVWQWCCGVGGGNNRNVVVVVVGMVKWWQCWKEIIEMLWWC